MNLNLLINRMNEIHMTPSQLIRESGVSKSTINRIFHGKTDLHTSTLRMIANAVGLDPSALIDDNADLPEAFDPDKVPEISAQVLEEITEMEQNDPFLSHMTPDDDTEVSYDTSLDVSPECEIFYERMIKYLRDRLDNSFAVNEQLSQQNTELVKANSRLIEQEATTRVRNRGLYTGMIIACIVAGLCLAGLVAYFIYDIMMPTWGIVRY